MDLPEIDRLVAINQKWSVSTIMLPVYEVAAMSALIKKQEQALADKDLALLEQVELVTAQVSVIDRLTLELAARQPLADSFVAPSVTVNTPEFQRLLGRVKDHENLWGAHPEIRQNNRAEFIAHIDAHTARAVATARHDGHEEGYLAAMAEVDSQPVAGELPPLPAYGWVLPGNYTDSFEKGAENPWMASAGAFPVFRASQPVQQPSPNSIGYNDDLSEGWERDADGRVQPVQQPAAVGRVIHRAVPGGGWYAYAQWSGQVPSDEALLYTVPVPAAGVQGDKLSEQKLADRLAGTSAMSPKDRRTLLNGDPVPFTLPQLTHIANLLTKDFALQTLSDISQIQEAASQPDSGRDAALVLPGCLADRLYEAIGIARERAQHAGSVERRKKWEATRADLQAALAAHPANGAQAGLSDERIVTALHSLGVDTYPSKFGFSTLQVSATNVPTIRQLVELLVAPQKKEG